MTWAVEALSRSRKITVHGLLEVHRRLLVGNATDRVCRQNSQRAELDRRK